MVREATMQDVARLAGVSIGTVSNVLNTPDRVAPETLDRVQVAIRAIGFVRNGSARALASGGAATIGVVIPSLASSFSIEIARGAQAAARAMRLPAVIATAEDDPTQQEACLDYFAEQRVRGVVFAPVAGSWDGAVERNLRGLRAVILNDDAFGHSVCTVDVDRHASGRIAAEHLLKRERHILFIAHQHESASFTGYREGLSAAVAARGGSWEQLILPDAVLDLGADAAIIGAILSCVGNRPSPSLAILVSTEALAHAIIAILRDQAGIEVPRDLSLMALVADRSIRYRGPSVSFLDLPAFEMGKRAVRRLIDEARPDHLHMRTRLHARLRIGGSTECAGLPFQRSS